MSPKKVLIIEDDNLMVKLYTTRLSYEGFAVTAAEDGEDGWDQFNAIQPDLVLLDLMLPKVSGLDILKKIRAQDQKTPVLVYTVLFDRQKIREAKLLGATQYFVKADTHPKQLVEIIKGYLTSNP